MESARTPQGYSVTETTAKTVRLGKRPPAHVWTLNEVLALPAFGNEHGWFYGLVECKEDDEIGVAIVEIIPGMGWAHIDPEDVSAQWEQISHDLANYRPWEQAT